MLEGSLDKEGALTPAPLTPAFFLLLSLLEALSISLSVCFTCSASSCVASTDTSSADPATECRGLAREVGALTTFVTDAGPISADRLARCNKAAPQPKS